MANNFIIAVDGTAASGKGTISSILAKHYNLSYLDTGLSYRAVAFQVLENNILHNDNEKILKVARDLDLGNLNKEILSSDIIGRTASIIATNKDLRTILVKKQQEFAQNATNGAILDGRDIGSVVCPNAQLKFFVDADVKIRAERRFKQFNRQISLQEILDQLIDRDNRDKNRPVGALMKLDDAILIDTTNLTIEEAVNRTKSFINPLLKQ